MDPFFGYIAETVRAVAEVFPLDQLDRDQLRAALEGDARFPLANFEVIIDHPAVAWWRLQAIRTVSVFPRYQVTSPGFDPEHTSRQDIVALNARLRTLFLEHLPMIDLTAPKLITGIY
jgi:hypothetical protein